MDSPKVVKVLRAIKAGVDKILCEAEGHPWDETVATSVFGMSVNCERCDWSQPLSHVWDSTGGEWTAMETK